MTTAIDVACFGELLWDFYEAEGKQFRREAGGTSANVAIALARLGIKSSAVGAVGKDKLGIALDAQLAADGVDTEHVVKLGFPTGITFVTRDAGGEPSFAPYRNGTADGALSADDVSAAMAKARYCVLSTTSMLGPTRSATEKFLAAADKAKATVVVDLNVRAHLWPDADAMKSGVSALAGRAHLVKASEGDLCALAGKRGITWLEDNAKQATWLLTRGENGAAAVGAHGQVTAPTKRVRCIDASGGGDAFVAGVLAVLVRAGVKHGAPEWKDGKLWTRALEVGHLVAAKAVAAVGATAGIVSVEDVKTRLAAAKKG